jgi:ribosomal protein L18E
MCWRNRSRKTTGQNEASTENLFIQAMTTSVKRWAEIAEERLEPIEAKTIINTGRIDRAVAGDIIVQSEQCLVTGIGALTDGIGFLITCRPHR